jgi:hypothetical protein
MLLIEFAQLAGTNADFGRIFSSPSGMLLSPTSELASKVW